MPPSKGRKTSTTKKTAASNGPRRQRAAQPTPQPMPQDPNSAYAPTTWGSIGGVEDLTVPSGQLCQVKRPGVEGLMRAGVLHKVDALSSIVNQKHIKRVGGKGDAQASQQINVASLMNDEKALDDVMHVVNRVVCHVVIQPPIYMPPNDVTSRVPDVIYADQVDIMDKMFIFNYSVGGSRDLERFRGEFEQSVGGVEAVEGVEDAPE